MNISDPRTLINQILHYVEVALALCLLILLAGVVFRAMRFGALSQLLPSGSEMQIATMCVALWAIAGKARV